MTIKIGTIQEITGEGFEILVDSETRSYVLAKFYDGQMVETANGDLSVNARSHSREKTVVAAG